MLPRAITAVLRNRLSNYPAVALLGPRHSGKTTLAASLGGRYFDIEQEADRMQADLAWNSLAAGRELVILDEAQGWPDLFVRLRGAIDADRRRNGRFLVLGSVSPALMSELSESLAGRLAIVEMTPFAASEITPAAAQGSHWLCGGYPDGGALAKGAYPRWQRHYLELLAQRDLPQWGLPARAQTTVRLLKMVAAAHGQEWNASRIGRSMALSYHTVNHYMDYLEGAFLVRRLAPFRGHLRKRLDKRPKVYWRDTGLLHALMNVADEDSLLNQPWIGASWEGYVIEQVLAALQQADRLFEAYHFRTSDQRQIDLLVQLGTELWAIESRLTTNPRQSDLERLDANADLVGAQRRFLVCRNSDFIEGPTSTICDLDGLVRHIRYRSHALG